MAETVASLMAELGLDPREFLVGMQQASKANAEFMKSMSSLANELHRGDEAVKQSAQGMNAMSVAMGNLVSEGIQKLGGMMKGVANDAVQMAAKVESLTVVSRFLGNQAGYTSKQIDDMTAALVKKGITTANSRDALIQMTKAELDLSKAVELGGVAQNFARASGKNSSEVMSRLIHGIQTLNTETLRNVGVVLNTDKVYKDYAESLNKVNVGAGKTAGTLSAQERQQAFMNAVMAEGAKVNGIYGVTMDVVAGKQQSLDRVQKEASLAIGNFYLPALRLYVDAQTKFYKEVAKAPEFFSILVAALAGTVVAFGAYTTAVHFGFLASVKFTAFLTTMLGPWVAIAAAVYIFISAITGTLDPMKNLEAIGDAVSLVLKTIAFVLSSDITKGFGAAALAVGGYVLIANGATLSTAALSGAMAVLKGQIALISLPVAAAVAALALFVKWLTGASSWIEAADIAFDALHIGVLAFVVGLEQLGIAILKTARAALFLINPLGEIGGVNDKIRASIDANIKALEAHSDSIAKDVKGIISQTGDYKSLSKAMEEKLGKTNEEISAQKKLDEARKASSDFAKSLGLGPEKMAEQAAEIKKIMAAVREHGIQSGSTLRTVTGALSNLGDAGEAKAKQLQRAYGDAFDTIQVKIEKFLAAQREIAEIENFISAETLGSLMSTAGGNLKKDVFAIPQITTSLFGDSFEKQAKDRWNEYQAALQDQFNMTLEQDSALSVFPEFDASKAALAADAADRYSEYMAKSATETTKLNSALSVAKDLMDVLGIKSDSFIGKLVGGFSSAAKLSQDLFSSIAKGGFGGTGGTGGNFKFKDMDFVGIIQSLAGVVGAFKKATDSASTFERAVGGAALGAKVGEGLGEGIGMAIGGPVMAATGKMIGKWGGMIIGGIAGIFSKPEWAKVGEEAGKILGTKVSRELAEQIQKTAKDLKIDIKSASLLNLDKVMGDKDPRQFASQISELMKGIASGAIPAKEGVAQIGKAFDAVKKAAQEAGRVGDATMVMMLKTAREAKDAGNPLLYTKEMQAHTAENLEAAAGGFDRFIAGMSKVKDFDWSGMGGNASTMFMASFNALAAEKGWPAAVARFKAGGDKLVAAIRESLGSDSAAEAILAPFVKFSAYMENEALAGFMEAAAGVNQMMVGLADAGYLSTVQFSAMQAVTVDLFNGMVAGGMETGDALLAIAPNIQAAINAAQQFGVPLDANMQKLKEQAEQSGITFSTDPMLRMVEVLEAIARVLGAELPTATKTFADSLNTIPREVNVDFNVRKRVSGDAGGYIPGDPGGNSGGGPVGPPDEYAATGFYSPSMPRGPRPEGMTYIGVHPGEEVSVTPKGKSGSGPSGGGGSVVVNFESVVVNAETEAGGSAAAKAFREDLEEALRNDSALRSLIIRTAKGYS